MNSIDEVNEVYFVSLDIFGELSFLSDVVSIIIAIQKIIISMYIITGCPLDMSNNVMLIRHNCTTSGVTKRNKSFMDTIIH